MHKSEEENMLREFYFTQRFRRLWWFIRFHFSTSRRELIVSRSGKKDELSHFVKISSELLERVMEFYIDPQVIYESKPTLNLSIQIAIWKSSAEAIEQKAMDER